MYLVGVLMSSIGAALLPLSRQVDTDVEGIGSLFVGRSIGKLLGTLIMGLLADRVAGNPLVAIALAACGIATALLPFATTVGGLFATITLQGFGVGAYNTLTNVLIMAIWHDAVGPWIQGMHSLFGLGAFSSQLLTGAAMRADGGNPRVAFLLFGAGGLVGAGCVLLCASPTIQQPQADQRSQEGAESQELHRELELEPDLDVEYLPPATLSGAPDEAEPAHAPAELETGPSLAGMRSTDRSVSVVAPGAGVGTSRNDETGSVLSEGSGARVSVNPVAVDVSLEEGDLPCAASASTVTDTAGCDAVEGATEAASAGHQRSLTRLSRQEWLLIACAAVLLLTYAGGEKTYNAYLIPYVVLGPLGLSESVGQVMASVFWFSFTLGRVACVPAAMVLTPTQLLIGSHIVCATALGTMLVWGEHDGVMWAGSVAFGVGLAPCYATVMTVTREAMAVRGAHGTVIVVGAGIGTMVLPPLTGVLFTRIGPAAFLGLLLTASLLAGGMFAVTVGVRRRVVALRKAAGLPPPGSAASAAETSAGDESAVGMELVSKDPEAPATGLDLAATADTSGSGSATGPAAVPEGRTVTELAPATRDTSGAGAVVPPDMPLNAEEEDVGAGSHCSGMGGEDHHGVESELGLARASVAAELECTTVPQASAASPC